MQRRNRTVWTGFRLLPFFAQTGWKGFAAIAAL